MRTISNASPRWILTHPRALLLALAAVVVLAAGLALRRAAEAPSIDRPVLVRRPEALPPLVVTRPPPARAAAVDDAGGR